MEEPAIQQTVEHPKEAEYHGIPIDAFRHMRVSLDGISGEELSHLKDIVAWSKEQSPSDYIGKIDELQRHLGKPNVNERAYDRVWRFVKMQKCINAVRG